MSSKDFRAGVEAVNKAAGDKFTEVEKSLGEIKTDIAKFSKNQKSINSELIDNADDHEDRLRALEDNRYFVHMSRHGLDDMNPIEQERLAAWLQKLMREFSDRGLPPTPNQQAFLANLFKYIGIHDELMEVDFLAAIEDFCDGAIHEAIYKIFLAIVYLHDESFSALEKFSDIDPLFRISQSDRIRLQRILEDERIPTLGIPGLIGMFDPGRPLNSFTPESLVSRYVTLNGHPLLDCEMQREERAAYLRALALLAPKTGRMTERQRNYVVSLANILGCPECSFEVEKLWSAPQTVNVRRWQDAIETDAAGYAWALDAVALLAFDDSFELKDTTNVEQILRGIKLNRTNDFIRGAFGLVRAKSAAELLEHIRQVWGPQHTDWRHVVDFCGTSTQGMFSDTISKLNELYKKATMLGLQIQLDIDLKSIEYKFGISDEFDLGLADRLLGKISNMVLENGRKGISQKLEKLGEQASEILDTEFSISISEANKFIELFGIPKIHSKPITLRFMSFDDINNSSNNNDWGKKIEDRTNTIQKCLDEACTTAYLIKKQLILFDNGKFYQSAASDREKEIAERARQEEIKKEAERQELAAKATVSVTVANKERRFSITWTDTAEPPFIPSDVSGLASDGQRWVAVTHKGTYISNNGNDWQQLDVVGPFSTVQYTDGTWILTDKRNSYAFSKDYITWHEVAIFESMRSIFSEFSIHRFNGQWILAGSRQTNVTCVEKGFIFDSKKTISYREPVFYRSTTLDGTWEFWDKPSHCGEGREMNTGSFYASDHILLGYFGYDQEYARHKKLNNNKHDLCYFSEKKQCWTDATWPKEVDALFEPKFFFSQNTFIFIPGTLGKMLISDNGYEWRTAEPDVWHDAAALEVEGILFVIDRHRRVMHVSSDRKEFKEMIFAETGSWDKFSSNGKEILAVYEPSRHESFLRKGIIKFAE